MEHRTKVALEFQIFSNNETVSLASTCVRLEATCALLSKRMTQSSRCCRLIYNIRQDEALLVSDVSRRLMM